MLFRSSSFKAMIPPFIRPNPIESSTLFTDICQLRLDFQSFQTLGPPDSVETGGGACQDVLIGVGAGGPQTPAICGANNGQHSKLLYFRLRDS